MRRLALIGLVAIVTLVAAPAVFAVTITLMAATLTASAGHSGAGVFDSETATPTSLPATGTINAVATVVGATTMYDLSDAEFNISFSAYGGPVAFGSASNTGDLSFVPSDEIAYVLTLSYSGNRPLSFQFSDATTNQLMAFAGVLAANHVYQLSYSASALPYMVNNPPSQGSAVGEFSLSFIPEPSAALLLAIGLSGLWARRTLRA